jgi:protein-S-isoprenylcysteine O-methyltransferase Ste14
MKSTTITNGGMSITTISAIVAQLLTLMLTLYLLFYSEEHLHWLLHSTRPGYWQENNGGGGLPSIAFRTTIAWMVIIRVFSQCFFFLALAPYQCPIPVGISIAIFNLVCDWLNVIFADYGAGKFVDFPHDHVDMLAAALFVFGILFERIPEIQRVTWKAEPANSGKSHQRGVFGYIVHANYTGYTLWRFGMSLASRSIVTQIVTCMNVVVFVWGEIPQQHKRNLEKYGPSFDVYWKNTWKFLPGIY